MYNRKDYQEQYLCNSIPKEQSELLTQFYKDYLAWIDDGAPSQPTFKRHMGLCGNLRMWAIHYLCMNDIEYREIRNELKEQFCAKFLDYLHPFHLFASEFNAEVDQDTCHLNVNRIQWVRSHAQ